MAREGTRSATGNSKPRVFATVDTAPTFTRAAKAKATTTKTPATKASVSPPAPKATKAPATKASKPVGVTKKKAAPKGESATAKKVRPHAGLPPGLHGASCSGTHTA